MKTDILPLAILTLFLCFTADVFAKKAVLLVGQLGTFDDDGNFQTASQYVTDVARNTMNEAKSDYEDAGYEVMTNFDAVSQDFINALEDTNTCAIWFFGHGDCEQEGVGSIWMTTSQGNHDILNTRNRALAGKTFPHIKQVTFHACEQDKVRSSVIRTSPMS